MWKKFVFSLSPKTRVARWGASGAFLVLALWLTGCGPQTLPCYPNCVGQNFSGRLLRNYVLSNAALNQINLSRSDLTGADLHGADLQDADLREARLNGADLTGANLTGANLTNAHLVGVQLDGADLSAAILKGATLSRVSLTNVKLNGAYLDSVRMIGANLQFAKLKGADLSNANLIGANLSYAELSGGYLDNALLMGANLYRADLSGGAAREANFNGSRLTQADLRGVNFADLSYKTLQTGAYLSGVDARQANFSGSNLEGTDLSGSRFDGAIFTGVYFQYSTPNGAIFTGANLDKATFWSYVLVNDDPETYEAHAADLFGVSLANASLRNAWLAGVTARGINLRGADLTGATLSSPIFNLESTFTGLESDDATQWPQLEVAQVTAPILTLFAWRAEDAPAMQRILAAFNAQHPEFQVVYEAVANPSEYNQILRDRLANGTAPDLLYLRSFSGSDDLVNGGALVPLDTLPEIAQNYSPESLSPWTNNYGIPYAVPFIATSHGLYYNQTIFNKLGLEPPAHWEDLLRLAQTLKSNGITPFANGSKDTWTTAELMLMGLAPNFIDGREGRLAYLSGERCFNDQRAVAAFQALADLRPFLPNGQQYLSYTDSQALFLSGQAAMMFDGSWAIPYYEATQPAFAWSVFAVPPPFGNPPYVTFHLDAGVGLNAQSPHLADAKTFLSWLASAEAADLLANELPGFFPLRNVPPTITNQHASDFLALNTGRGTDVRWAWPSINAGTPSGYALMEQGAFNVLMAVETPQQAADHLQAGLSQWFGPAQTCQTR